MNTEIDKCDHYWIANSGYGGEPVFKTNRTMSMYEPIMHVKCLPCGCRTWFSKKQWNDLPATSKEP